MDLSPSAWFFGKSVLNFVFQAKSMVTIIDISGVAIAKLM